MCKNATATAASLMSAIRPTLVSLLTLEGLANTPDGIAAITAFDAAETALAAWTPGTDAQTVVEALDAFTAVFNVLPIPAEAKELESLISAGIVAVIGLVVANSPAPPSPAPAEGAATPDEIQASHALATASDTTEKVSKLVPGFKRSHFHGAAHQYKTEWNKAVKAAGSKYSGLAA